MINFTSKAEILQCPLCADIIQSHHHYQLTYCECKNIFTDGGNEYERYGWELGNPPIIIKGFQDTND